MADRTAPTRIRRKLATGAAAGSCALVLALAASACSGDHASANDAAGRPKASATPSQVDSYTLEPSSRREPFNPVD